MGARIIAIGLDAADPQLVDRWMAEGHLPNIRKVREQGLYADLFAGNHNISETSWTTFFTGCWPAKTGFWSQIKYSEDKYAWKGITYDYKEYAPFYAMGGDRKVAMFDLPQAAIADEANGIQVLAWGTHSAQTPSVSKPADLLQRIRDEYGSHPALNKDHARLWQKGSLRRLLDNLREGLDLRRRICIDLLKKDDWDLFFTVFAETHSGGHYLYHLSQDDHPWHDHFKGLLGDEDPLLTIYKETDAAVGDIIENAPEDAHILLFSQEGTVANNLDLTGMLFLPEMLYRFAFPDRTGFAGGRYAANTPPPPMVTRPKSFGWVREVWSTKADSNPLRKLVRKNALLELSHKFDRIVGLPPGPHYPYEFTKYYFQPALWYSPFWPQMPAFALPTYCDGYVRINLEGREKDGIVDPKDYESLCDRLSDHISALRDPRTQKPIVKEIYRPHNAPDGERVADPDLVVVWDSDVPCDLVDSPDFGRIGPVPHRRSGGHNNAGFLIAKGPGIEANSNGLKADLVDIAPTILNLMGAPVPGHMDGKPLL